ncbi:hypothetical protein JL720_15170 [Aureococcus anophagefferens]|nr:hypothetical protein JL720_15170 [Aureococcus anophagefferens]
MDVLVRDEMVEQVKAGDKIVATGCLAVMPDTGGLARAGEATLHRAVGGVGGGCEDEEDEALRALETAGASRTTRTAS